MLLLRHIQDRIVSSKERYNLCSSSQKVSSRSETGSNRETMCSRVFSTNNK
jgi:hypothetical protein